MITIGHIAEFVADKHPNSLNCHAESRRFEDILRDELGADVRRLTGQFIANPNDSDSRRVTHGWVQIPAREVSDAVADVIVDPTIQQFVEADLGGHPVDTLDMPDDIGVFPLNSPEGEHYEP